MSNKIWPLLPSVVAALVAATATTLQPATSALAHAPLRSPAVLTAPQAADADLAAALLNRYRSVAGLPPVAVGTGNSAAAAHAHYLALNKGNPAIAGLLAHTEQPGLPGYTA